MSTRRNPLELIGRQACVTWLDNEAQPQTLTGADLRASAADFARALKAQAPAGARVVLAFPPGLEFVRAFYAVLAAGMVAVPVPLPRRRDGGEGFAGIVEDCSAALVWTLPAHAARLATLLADCTSATRVLDLVVPDPSASNANEACEREEEQACVLQYTSGSTGRPKGVVLTLRNIQAQLVDLAQASGFASDSVVMSWLPHFHDMGLFGGLMLPVSCDAHTVLASPQSCYVNPRRWLEAMSRFKATHCSAPNSAYARAARLPRDPADAHLDLSHWQHAHCGSEPVFSSALKAFADRFSDAGFKESAFQVCYGLAEATLAVTMREQAGGIAVLAPNSLALVNERNGTRFTEMVACGTPLASTKVSIVRPGSDETLADGVIGEVFVSSPSCSAGYWNDANVHTRANPGEQSIRTGDLGLLLDGQLYVCGRIKDTLFNSGQNVYAPDLENFVSRHIPDAAEVVAVPFRLDDRESICVVVAQGGNRALDWTARCADLMRQVQAQLGVELGCVAVVVPQELPRTTSGKLRRAELSRRLGIGELRLIHQHFPGMAPSAERERIPDSNATFAEQLADVARKQFSLHALGVDETFYSAGISSLSFVEYIEHIEQVFGCRFPTESLRETLTPLQLAQLARPDDQRVLEAEPACGDEGRPLSFPEQSQYRVWRQSANGHGCLFLVRFDTASRTSLPEIEAAVRVLVSRHEILATRYRATESGVRAFHAGPDLPACVLKEVDPAEHVAAVAAMEAALMESAFALDRESALRVGVVQSQADQATWCLVAHHIAFDVEGLRLLVRDLLEALADRNAMRAPIQGSYARFARTQVSTFTEASLNAAHRDYADHVLLAPPQSATVVPAVRNGARRGASERLMELGVGLMQALVSVAVRVASAQAPGCTTDVHVGVDTRDAFNCRGVVGHFGNAILLRFDPSTFADPRADLPRIAGAFDRAIVRKHLPKLRNLSRAQSVPGQSPVSIYTTYIDMDSPGWAAVFGVAGATSMDIRLKSPAERYDVTVVWIRRTGRLIAQLEVANTQLDAHAIASALRAELQELVGSMDDEKFAIHLLA